jgi:hypothetical protein
MPTVGIKKIAVIAYCARATSQYGIKARSTRRTRPIASRKRQARRIGVRAQFGDAGVTLANSSVPNWDPTPNLLLRQLILALQAYRVPSAIQVCKHRECRFQRLQHHADSQRKSFWTVLLDPVTAEPLAFMSLVSF